MSRFTQTWTSVAVILSVVIGCVFTVRLIQTDPQERPILENAEIANENAEVFRRIFWRQPTPEDRILQSERRELEVEEGGSVRWDWFLSVDPSVGLADYLLIENPFQLSLGTSVIDFQQAPEWFPRTSAGFEVHQNQTGEMTVLHHPETRRIYVWNKARAFRPAATIPEPSITPSTRNNSGRLPDASPPIPQRQ